MAKMGLKHTNGIQALLLNDSDMNDLENTEKAMATDLLIVGIRDCSINLKTDRIMRQAVTRYNHGRACKVSFRRPSPRLSRAQLEQIKVMAILDATLAAQLSGT